MLNFVLKRLAIAVPTLLILIVLSYILMYAAPGGPFTREKALPPQVIANLQARYGFDEPLWKQILIYVWNIVAHFDFGPSYIFKDRTVNDIIGQGFPVTLRYGIISFFVASFTGILLGVVAAIRHNTVIDYFAVGISIGAAVLPSFVLAPDRKSVV